MSGGAGVDTASYRDHTEGVSVRLDDLNNDGNDVDGSAPGSSRGDDVRSDVENVDGTEGNDLFVGSAGPNRLRSFGGIDLLDGGAGRDVVLGGDGDDREIDTDDGEPDEVSCGAGRDFARVDLVDRAADSKFNDLPDAPEILPPRDCEGLEIVPFGEQAAVQIRRGAIGLAADRRSVRVRLDCRATAAGGCRGRLLVDALLRRDAKRLAARPYAVAAGRSSVVRLALEGSVRRAEALRATALAVGPSGRHHAVIGLVALRR
jgi:hypothetical protein